VLVFLPDLTPKVKAFKCSFNQGILKGEVSLYY
jgi:hypothetical protein